MSGRDLKQWVPPLLLCAAGMAIAFWPMLSSGFARMQADPGDTRHLNYVLEHVYLWMSGRPGFEDVWGPAIFFPEPRTGAYTELLLGVAPLYAGWRALGLSPDSAFQAWMLTVGALNFVAAWSFLRHPLAASGWAASAGAFVFAFGSARLNQLNHQHLLPHFFTIIALHAAVRTFQMHQGGRRRAARFWLGAFFAALAAQLYAGVYFGWFLGFLFGLGLLWALALGSLRAPLKDYLRAHAWALCAGVAGLLAVVAPMLMPYLGAGRAVGYRSFAEAAAMIPRAHTWFYMGGHSWLYGWTHPLPPFSQLPMAHEHAVGLGLGLTLVMLFVLWRERRRPLAKVLGLVALTLVLLVTRYRGGFTPWELVFEWVPGANALRAVSRVGMLMLIPAAVALAWFVDWSRQHARPALRYGGLALAAFCLLEQGQTPYSYDKQTYRDRVTALAAAVDPTCRAFFFAPSGSPHGFEETQLDAMWAQLQLGVPTVNGYSSNFPRGWELLDHRIFVPADQERLEAALRSWLESRGLDAEDGCWVQRPFGPG